MLTLYGSIIKALVQEKNCGNTQVSHTIQDKDSIRVKLFNGFNLKMKYLTPRHVAFEDLNHKLFQSFIKACNLGCMVTDPLHIEIDLDNFCGCHGWHDSFELKH